MKKPLLFLLLFALSFLDGARAQSPCSDDDTVRRQEACAAAQDTLVVIGADKYCHISDLSDMADLRAHRREYWRAKIDMHDVRLGIGSINLSTMMMLSNNWFGDCCDGWAGYRDFRDQMLDMHTYLTPERLVGTFSLSYVYHGRRRVQVGLMATFAAVTQRRKNIADDRTIDNFNRYSASLLPIVRLMWVHRKNVSLYSSVGLGLALTVDDDTRILPWYDVSLIGCTFGRKLFGFAELGAGMGGMLRVVVGYRFNDFKRKGDER